MGFTWAQSSEALKTHSTLEEAVEALFGGDSNPAPAGERHKMFLKVGKMTCHLSDDVLVFELSYCLFCSLQRPAVPVVPVVPVQSNQWCRKKTTMRASGSSYKRAVPERSRSKSLMLSAKSDRNLSHRLLIQGIQ